MTTRKFLPLIVTIGYLFLSGSEVKQPTFYLGGIEINEASQEEWVKTLKAAGMNTVELTVYAHQGNWRTDHMWYDTSTITIREKARVAKNEGLKVVLIPRMAIDHAFDVNEFTWHGMIYPETERHVEVWFWQYSRYIQQWAKVAEEENIDVLAIGSEMNALTATRPIDSIPNLEGYFLDSLKQAEEKSVLLSFQAQLEERHLWMPQKGSYSSLEKYLDAKLAKQKEWAMLVTHDSTGHSSIEKINSRRTLLEQYWRALIQETRKIYSGKLTYAANFDNYADVAFWDDLDMIGINAYFELNNSLGRSTNPDSLYTICYQGWDDVFQEINVFKQDLGIDYMPVLFTELGYTNRKFTTARPWSSSGFTTFRQDSTHQLFIWEDQPLEPNERATAVKALYDYCENDTTYLNGILYWKLSTHDYHKPHEPYMMHLAVPPTDSLQTALLRFIEEPRN